MKRGHMFGERLKQTRIAAGLNQKELGEKAGVSDAFIAMLEKGRRTASHLVLDEISTTLGCSIDYLVKGTCDENTRTKIGGW